MFDELSLIDVLIHKVSITHPTARPLPATHHDWDLSLTRDADTMYFWYEHQIETSTGQGWSSAMVVVPLTDAAAERWAFLPAESIYLGGLKIREG